MSRHYCLLCGLPEDTHNDAMRRWLPVCSGYVEDRSPWGKLAELSDALDTLGRALLSILKRGAR